MPLQMRKIRLANNWTAEFVAKNIGVSKQMICDIEKNKRKPSYKVLVKLEDFFHKNHKELFYNDASDV